MFYLFYCLEACFFLYSTIKLGLKKSYFLWFYYYFLKNDAVVKYINGKKTVSRIIIAVWLLGTIAFFMGVLFGSIGANNCGY